MSDEKLKDCPFCGGWTAMIEESDGVWGFNCRVDCDLEFTVLGTREQAVEKWNTRAEAQSDERGEVVSLIKSDNSKVNLNLLAENERLQNALAESQAECERLRGENKFLSIHVGIQRLRNIYVYLADRHIQYFESELSEYYEDGLAKVFECMNSFTYKTKTAIGAEGEK